VHCADGRPGRRLPVSGDGACEVGIAAATSTKNPVKRVIPEISILMEVDVPSSRIPSNHLVSLLLRYRPGNQDPGDGLRCSDPTLPVYLWSDRIGKSCFG
jgi:hypothetical protein